MTSGVLRERGIRTVGHVARIGEAALVSMLGAHAGRHLHALAHNRDPRPVQVGRRRRSMGAQHALGRRRRSLYDVDTVLAGLVDRVTGRMRKAERVGRTVTLRMRFDDYSRATRSHTLARATADTRPILDAARRLLATAAPMIAERGLTLVGVAVANLDDAYAVQLTLPFDGNDGPDLDSTLDEVRRRFGAAAVTRARQVGTEPGLTMPMLPD